MNIVVSLFAQENEEKYVIRFKKIAAGDTNSEYLFIIILNNQLRDYELMFTTLSNSNMNGMLKVIKFWLKVFPVCFNAAS